MFRERPGSEALAAVVAGKGSKAERELLKTLGIDPHAALRQFAPKAARDLDQPGTATLTQLGLLDRKIPSDGAHPLITEAARAGRIPSTAKLAAAAQEEVRRVFGLTDPDEFIFRALEAETRLFNAIESAVEQPKLERLKAKDAALNDVIAFTMSILQSRKSRRGHSLQHHFAALLAVTKIPFTAQCETENGEKPDFVIPGSAAYRDPSFPSQRLRMVGCKSRVRERWRQILTEAERITEKHLLTVDEDLTASTIAEIRRNHVRVFLPARVIHENYADNRGRPDLETVADLVDDLKMAVGS